MPNKADSGENEVVNKFARYAEQHHTQKGTEAVALIGLCLFGIAFVPLPNSGKAKASFRVSAEDVSRGLRALAKEKAWRAILAHSHAQGAGTPSNRFPEGDVQEMGDPIWVSAMNRFLSDLGITPPIVHLVYSLNGKYRFVQIDQRIGNWVSRKRGRGCVTVRLGWRQLSWKEVLRLGENDGVHDD